MFGAAAQSKRGLRPFDAYLKRIRNGASEKPTGASAFNFFSALKARGLPISIDRVTRH